MCVLFLLILILALAGFIPWFPNWHHETEVGYRCETNLESVNVKECWYAVKLAGVQFDFKSHAFSGKLLEDKSLCISLRMTT